MKGPLGQVAEVGVDVVGPGVVVSRAGVVTEYRGQVPEAPEGKISHEEKLEANEKGQGTGPIQESSEHGAVDRDHSPGC